MEITLKSLQEVEAQLEAADPDALEALIKNARDAGERAIRELQSNRDSQSELRTSLDLRGEACLQGLLDEALSELQQVERAWRRVPWPHVSRKRRSTGTADRLTNAMSSH